ncbi:WXG100 family type VII secretion target [Stackebrandtia nassauensis]|uniref:Uncharacterized protein n=1 Tax=Stackebrandtia nassauensis (strain DSM 44728 / CIP 108903 / NRRL B-16338 / NBRC 102104 / LLR-40K-21) TaxID=446470 RepID=D3Q9J7_STANL|nr:hypothetical protein [Stackebrandtia nassauensis]ADD42679.1 hypothetical protein Snas_3008 [Stackebrandtia nassauensis DSM 44728]
MKLYELRRANFETFRNTATVWKEAVDTFQAAGDDATNKVGDPIRNGTWEGDTGTAAGDKAKKLESQLDAAVTEASTVKQVLEEAAGLFKQHQDEVEQYAKQVDDNSRLSFTGDDGEIRILPPSGHSTLSGEAAKDAEDQLAKLRTDLQMKVQLGLAKARNLDNAVAEALLGASNMDESPDDPNFNVNAAQEGKLDLDSNNSKGDWLAFIGSIASRTGGSPEAQSAWLGDQVRKHVEAGGGVCKLVDGLMVCVGAPWYMYLRAGTTIGDTFISDYETFDAFERDRAGNSHGLIDHEKYHRDEQWRKYGYSFAAKYGGEELWTKLPFTDDTNKYEREAEDHGGDGGYNNPHGTGETKTE